jgi:hypothetical protein
VAVEIDGFANRTGSSHPAVTFLNYVTLFA